MTKMIKMISFWPHQSFAYIYIVVSDVCCLIFQSKIAKQGGSIQLLLKINVNGKMQVIYIFVITRHSRFGNFKMVTHTSSLVSCSKSVLLYGSKIGNLEEHIGYSKTEMSQNLPTVLLFAIFLNLTKFLRWKVAEHNWALSFFFFTLWVSIV